jgi:acyl carrier protein
MNRKDFLNRVEEILELPEGSLKGDQQLANLAAWDSMAVLAFIAMVDDALGVQVSPAALAKCKVVSDLVALVGDKVTA